MVWTLMQMQSDNYVTNRSVTYTLVRSYFINPCLLDLHNNVLLTTNLLENLGYKGY